MFLVSSLVSHNRLIEELLLSRLVEYKQDSFIYSLRANKNIFYAIITK